MREQAIDLRLQPLYLRWRRSENTGGVLEHLRTAEALANALGDQRRLARVNAYIARVALGAEVNHEQAVTACERAIAMATEP